MIGNIIVRYFHGHKTMPRLEKHIDKTEYPYSKEKRNEIIDDVIEAGYNVMIQTVIPSLGEGHQIIWIDKYRFQQR